MDSSSSPSGPTSDPFFMYVSIGAAVILIVVLAAFGVMMYRLKSSDVFPPTQNACPDLWAIDPNNRNACIVPPTNTSKNRGDITYVSGHPEKIEGSSNSWLTHLNGSATDASSLTLNGNDASWNALYPGLTTRCAQKKWAANRDLVWDGITNYTGC